MTKSLPLLVNFFAHHWYLYTFHTYSYTRRASLPGPDFTFRHSEEYKSGVCVTHTPIFTHAIASHISSGVVFFFFAQKSLQLSFIFICVQTYIIVLLSWRRKKKMNSIFTFLLLYFVSFIRGTSVIGSNNEGVEIYKKYVHDDCTMFLTCDVNTSLRKMEDYRYAYTSEFLNKNNLIFIRRK